jgi:hypothetical protein
MGEKRKKLCISLLTERQTDRESHRQTDRGKQIDDRGLCVCAHTHAFTLVPSHPVAHQCVFNLT